MPSSLTDGSNTDLAYTFGDGWSVEVHGKNTKDNMVTFLYSIVNHLKEEVYEGGLRVNTLEFTHPVAFTEAIVGVIYALREDLKRMNHPGYYTEPNDKGIVIAGDDERIRLWLSILGDDALVLALNEMSGSTRSGRKVHRVGEFRRLSA